MVSWHVQAVAGVNSIKTFARQSTEVFSNVRWHEAIYFMRHALVTLCACGVETCASRLAGAKACSQQKGRNAASN
jgi:hypothetical protein